MLSLPSCCRWWVRCAAFPYWQQVSGLIVRAKGRSYSAADTLTQWLFPPSHLTFPYRAVQYISSLRGDLMSILLLHIMISSTLLPQWDSESDPLPVTFSACYILNPYPARWCVFKENIGYVLDYSSKTTVYLHCICNISINHLLSTYI